MNSLLASTFLATSLVTAAFLGCASPAHAQIFDVTTQGTFDDLNDPPGDDTQVQHDFFFNVSGLAGNVVSVELRLDLFYTTAAITESRVSLISPNGTQTLILFDSPDTSSPGGEATFNSTLFSDSGSALPNPLDEPVGPGPYQPQSYVLGQQFANFLPMTAAVANDVWTLRFFDTAGGSGDLTTVNRNLSDGSGTELIFTTAVPEPQEYAAVFGLVALAIGVYFKHKRLCSRAQA